MMPENQDLKEEPPEVSRPLLAYLHSKQPWLAEEVVAFVLYKFSDVGDGFICRPCLIPLR
jgi:hypothetical protein